MISATIRLGKSVTTTQNCTFVTGTKRQAPLPMIKCPRRKRLQKQWNTIRFENGILLCFDRRVFLQFIFHQNCLSYHKQGELRKTHFEKRAQRWESERSKHRPFFRKVRSVSGGRNSSFRSSAHTQLHVKYEKKNCGESVLLLWIFRDFVIQYTPLFKPKLTLTQWQNACRFLKWTQPHWNQRWSWAKLVYLDRINLISANQRTLQ